MKKIITVIGSLMAIFLLSFLFSCTKEKQEDTSQEVVSEEMEESKRAFHVSPYQYENWKLISKILYESEEPTAKNGYQLLVDTFEAIKENKEMTCSHQKIQEINKMLVSLDHKTKLRVDSLLVERGYEINF